MNEKQFKVIFVGDVLVGKTSFIIKYTQNKFSPTYKSTIGRKDTIRSSGRLFVTPFLL